MDLHKTRLALAMAKAIPLALLASHSAQAQNVDLAAFSNGFRIDGASSGDFSGFSVSGAGDVNGDGLADLIIGASGAAPGGDSDAGSSYVVFGKTGTATVDLDNLGNNGFRIDGADAADQSGFSVSGAGDVNGDGLADLIVGARDASLGATYAGSSYVVFGKTNTATVDLNFLGSNGFRIDGVNAGDNSGSSVSGAGDVNGDGPADLIVGASRADPGGDASAGSSYVVFGKTSTTTVDLANFSNGFRIDGVNVSDYSGASVSGAGDVNGDGLADLIIGASRADPGGDASAGSSYVVFGKTGTGIVNLANLGLSANGFRIDGVNAGDQSGRSVSAAGDVNGDGLADLIVGAPLADPGGNSAAGSSYVVFSEQTPSPSATYQTRAFIRNSPRLAIGTSGDGSNASHPDSRTWVDFKDGVGFFNLPSPVRVTRVLSSGGYSSAAANVSWQLPRGARFNWTTAEVTFRYLDTELTIANENLLQLIHSVDGNPPFTPLPSVVNPLNNTISATVSEFGFFYLGELDDSIFSDGFE